MSCFKNSQIELKDDLEACKLQIFENLEGERLFELERVMRLKDNSRFGSSASGFLREEESLFEIIERDFKILVKNGVSHKKIACKLEYFFSHVVEYHKSYNEVRAGLLEDSEHRFLKHPSKGQVIDNTFHVVARMYRGVQECPFGTEEQRCEEDNNYGFMDCRITNRKNGRSVFISGFLAHLIRKHMFFEGSVKYRVEPQVLIDVLGLARGDRI